MEVVNQQFQYGSCTTRAVPPCLLTKRSCPVGLEFKMVVIGKIITSDPSFKSSTIVNYNSSRAD